MSSSQVLLEARPFRPFRSSEEYLIAMKEDLAEWLQNLYPHLNINFDNFMDRLETGVALCEHSNAVKLQAVEYVEKKQAKRVMTKSVTGTMILAEKLARVPDVTYFATAKPQTFFARDNVSNFIRWCKDYLEIIECLLFESDDLILRKNEKHFILCLLEVARRGAKFGMLAPMLVQMERQIDREIAADMRKNNKISQEVQDQNGLDEDDSDMEDENPVLMYGPVPQIVTNDLKSLDEMVRDLVEQCTCPTQFPMIRVSEGKYRIGDTKVLIFVRILRNHVMVRVGGGWDTLSHYLDKHDPCRCRAQHRTTQGARLVSKPGAADLHGSHVYYERSTAAPTNANIAASNTPGSHHLGPPMNSLNRSRSRSPSHLFDSRRSVSPNLPRKSLAPPQNRSRSPTPNFVSTHQTKLSSNKSPKFSPSTSPIHQAKYANGKVNTQHIASIQIPLDNRVLKSETSLHVSESLTDQSDTTSELSDEGYRSLGLIDKAKQRSSFTSQLSAEDVEDNEHHLDGIDEINDQGLRRTDFSRKIYDDLDPKQKTVPVSRGSSLERPPTDSPKTRKSLPTSQKKSPSHSNTNTWNGRQKQPRPSVTTDTFTPFTRNTTSRRSVSSLGNERRASSANTSPTKSRLKQELINVVKHEKDDAALALQIQKLLEHYGSSDIKNSDEDAPQFRRNSERMSFRSPRKDSRPEYISKIPAPLPHKV